MSQRAKGSKRTKRVKRLRPNTFGARTKIYFRATARNKYGIGMTIELSRSKGKRDARRSTTTKAMMRFCQETIFSPAIKVKGICRPINKQKCRSGSFLLWSISEDKLKPKSRRHNRNSNQKQDHNADPKAELENGAIIWTTYNQ